MMRILALDLAWTGPTGWCLWDTDEDAPVQWGEFKPPQKKKLTRIKKIAHVSRSLHLETLNLIRDHHPSVIVYERTDWHRGDGRVNQAIERRNREALSKAELVVILVADKEGVALMDLGANEAKRAFGAMRKDAVAHLLANEYPGLFLFFECNGSYLTDNETAESISHHISDAMALAKVTARILRQEALVEHSQ